jgi:hypothetical protein
VCDCSLSDWECKAHIPYYTVTYFVCVCVCLYLTFFTLSHNFDSISGSSHPTECLLYVVDVSLEVSYFVTRRRKQIFLYDTKCLQSTRYSISGRRCSVAIYCTGCTRHFKPTVLEDMIILYHIDRGKYLYTCCKQNTYSCVIVLEEDQ